MKYFYGLGDRDHFSPNPYILEDADPDPSILDDADLDPQVLLLDQSDTNPHILNAIQLRGRRNYI